MCLGETCLELSRVRMDVSGFKKKFKALFDKLLHDKFELSAYHAESLLACLDDSRDKSVAKIIETPFFSELLIHAIKNYGIASTSVKIFITKLVTIVLHNEVHFNRFVHMHGFGLIIRSRADPASMPAAVNLAIAQQVNALTAHYTGVKYVIENKVYSTILTPNTYTKSPEITSIIYDFITKLIWKLNEYEEEGAMLEVLQYLVHPLMPHHSNFTSLEAENQVAVPVPPFSFLLALVQMLGEVEHLVAPNNVILIMSEVISIELRLTTALETTRDPLLARLLAEVWMRCRYAASRQAVRLDPDSESRHNQEFYAAFSKIMNTLIQKGSYDIVLEFLYDCHAFWHKIVQVVPPVAFERFGKEYLLQNQFLMLLLVPISAKQKSKRLVNDPTLEEANDMFHSNLADTVPYEAVNMAYDLSKLIMESEDDIPMVRAATCAVRQLLRLPRQLSRRQAGVVFQSLYYALSGYVLSNGSGDLVLAHNPLQAPDDERYLEHVLDAITMLLEEHEINWYESLEIAELQAVLMNLIKQNILPIKLLVQAVDLITVSVRKLLSPELALLLESRRGGSLRETADAARVLITRAECEARVAGLRLLLAFIDVAYVKFIPLRAVISEHWLMLCAARCALSDRAARARAAALRCLAAAARCDDLWKELLSHHHDLYEQLVSTLRHISEGEVRQEAANVLTHVYINHKVTDVFTSRVSRVMTRAAKHDAHWPVQIAALNYWKQCIKTQFTDKGMIDGTFPSVTFCKEKRKIIVLNDKEIHKQLENIMRHLSNSGCLAVLLKCMSPYNNREVIEIAYQLTSSIVEVLDCYKYNSVPSSKVSSQTSIVSLTDVEMGHTSQTSEPLKFQHRDFISEILECLGSESSEEDCSGPVEIVHPDTFVVTYREMAKKWPLEKVDLGTLIDELVSLQR